MRSLISPIAKKSLLSRRLHSITFATRYSTTTDHDHDHPNKMDYKNLSTPPVAVADFCLIPIGTPTASVSKEVAAVQKLMKASGLEYSMHSAGTTLEGSWDEVMKVIGQAHTLVHQNGVVRVQTDIRAGTRTDKKQRFQDKVTKVEALLAEDETAS